jgi:hypothetical protein
MNDEVAWWIGTRIFYNECGSNAERLITWNDGEYFISLGIGHFIWYPEGRIGPFHESFAELLRFIKRSGRKMPVWIKYRKDPRCPWGSKEEFLKNTDSSKAKELLEFLKDTTDLQLRFIVNRLKATLPKILEAAPQEERADIEKQFRRLTSTPAGLYAVIDYVNFKGQGLSREERYRDQGWGLLQVLERMKGDKPGNEAVREFVHTAEKLLIERVWYSPPERHEERWIYGWRARLETYYEAIDEDPSLLKNVNQDCMWIFSGEIVRYPDCNKEEQIRKIQ